ncbi:MAG: right-handed parallel beta-helix repeat-containing protein [Deltaproteobacteria bacterium]|nr:right-handed parallel beta-helix repeat-containing protein [Deltaproteobacteria bacterium]
MHTMRIAVLLALLAPPAGAATLEVGPGSSIQAAIDAAGDGDLVRVAAGTFSEDIDFRGKAITVVGAGAASTLLHGSGRGPVVTFAGGEGPDAVLDGLTITGGVALRGGGVRIVGSSPTVLRTIIAGNAAVERGSGVYVEASQASLRNNLIVYNRSAGGDPHSVEIQDGAPRLVNNTIARGDSNGIIVRGVAAPLIVNNVIAYNGSSGAGGRRGRGICDFSGGRARIRYNVFSRNRIAALLTDGTDFHRIRAAEARIAPPRLEGNRDGRPSFPRTLPREVADARLPEHFRLRAGAASRAIDAGDSDPAYADRDGSRNDVGFTGGPDAW